jgi:hypothetical protein
LIRIDLETNQTKWDKTVQAQELTIQPSEIAWKRKKEKHFPLNKFC